MEFEESYFRGEEREGFFVEEMMKRAWAAQLEVLKEIERVCKKHEIRYFADWGTLLGAVRHKGFIPWDDDMDICMKREDYRKFLAVAEHELPKEYALINIHTEENYSDLLTRVVNGKRIRFEKDHLTKYHGCPYVVGIDIFPLDYIPRNKEEEDMQCQLLEIVYNTAKLVGDADVDQTEVQCMVQQIEDLCHVKFVEEKPLKQQLFCLSEHICELYTEEDADEVALMPLFASDRNRRLPKSCYETTIEMPFENTTIPVPAGWDRILTLKYGDYMTPVREWDTHDYPFYRQQEEIAKAFLQENGIQKIEDIWRK